jgi:TolA-binding protein
MSDKNSVRPNAHSKTPFQLRPAKRRINNCAGKLGWLICLTGAICHPTQATPTVKQLEDAYDKSQWDEASEIAHEILNSHPNTAEAKLKGAYALFQKGYSNAALLFLRRMTPAEWKQIPKGYERLTEIVSLFQKKVPLEKLPSFYDNITPEQVSPNLREEVRYAVGRRAFEKKNFSAAKKYLAEISRSSRFFSEARYLLATIAVEEKDYNLAAQEFSKIFEVGVFDQATEFWKDFSSKTSKDWGPSVQVELDQDFLGANERLGELAIIGVARVQYATKEYENALRNYERIGKASRYYPRVCLERIWTLLSLNRNDEAAVAAQQLSFADNTFESIEAGPLLALILTDSGKSEQARQILGEFFRSYTTSKAALQKYKVVNDPNFLPAFMKHDLELDQRIQVRNNFANNLSAEIAKLNAEDRGVFPVYYSIAGSLDPLMTDSRNEVAKISMEHIDRRLHDLEKLHAQAKLIKVETFLEDREKLRAEFNSMKVSDPEKQKEHDQRLTQLLEGAVKEADEVAERSKQTNLNLEFRQSELLWELSSAHAILFQTSNSKADDDLATSLKERSVKMVEEIIRSSPTYSRRGQVLFFAGFAEIDTGRSAEGIKKLREFVQQFPKDPHVADAYRILADIDFDANRFGPAEASYRKVLEWQDSNIVGYALYKLGWCAYNLKNFSKAILALEQTIVWTAQQAHPSNLLNLEREARRDLISIYAEVGDTSKAKEYFEKFLRGDASPWILDLAKELDHEGQYEKSAELFKTLVTMNPTSPDNLAYQGAILWGAYRLHHWDQVEQATKDLVEIYHSGLATPQTDDKPAALVEKRLREIVMVHHKEFGLSTAPEDRARTLHLDNLYLEAFRDWPESETPLNEHAYYLLQIKDYPASVQAYRDHWNRFQAKVTPARREEGLRDVIHSLEELEIAEKAKTDSPSQTVKDLEEYAALYQKEYPSTKYSRPIAYLAAVLLFKYNDVDNGIVASKAIFDQNPQDDFGKKSFQNLRTAYYKKKDWKATYEWATELKSRQFAGMQLYAQDLKTIREESVFLWAENTEDNAKAAELYLQIADMKDMGRLWDKSLYNAFIRFQKAGMKIEALQAANRLERVNQTFSGLSDISGVRSALYQEAGDYATALPLLLGFLDKVSKDTPPEATEQARLNAGLIAEATERYDLATKLFNAYVADSAKGTKPGVEEAKRGLDRIAQRSQRQPASEIPQWAKMVAAKKAYMSAPLPKTGELAPRIQEGGQRLEKLSTEFLAISNDPKAPLASAFEAYCAVPLLYNAYQLSLQELGKTFPAEVQTELDKISSPLAAKAKELGEECLKRSVEAEHDGPFFREVNQTWGWQHDPAIDAKVKKVITLMQPIAPWLDPSTVEKSEDEIIKMQIQNQGSPDTWYALARLRYQRKAYGLCRLTLIDALQKSKNTGRVLNALAVLAERSNDTKGLTALYSQAASQGSPVAWANLALYQFKGGRLNQGLEALHHAVGQGVFVGNPELATLEKEWTK